MYIHEILELRRLVTSGDKSCTLTPYSTEYIPTLVMQVVRYVHVLRTANWSSHVIIPARSVRLNNMLVIDSSVACVGHFWHYTQDQIPSHKKVFFPIWPRNGYLLTHLRLSPTSDLCLHINTSIPQIPLPQY